VKLKIEGDVEFDQNPVPPGQEKFDGNADLTLPSSVNFGIANHSIRKLHLGLDFVWTEWSTYEELVYEFGTGYPDTPVTPNPEVIPKRWDNVWSVRLGAEYEMTEMWALRAGYVRDHSPVDEATRAPELPGSDRQMLMAGVGWKWRHLGIDAAYTYLWAEKVTTGSEVTDLAPRSAGEYETDTHLVSLSASYTF
jgi:long-chain fatty acid transport protein